MSDYVRILADPRNTHGVYIVGYTTQPEDFYVKIGLTSSIGVRFASLQTGSPHKLEVYAYQAFGDLEAASAFERALHLMLRPWHVLGEWFEITYIELEWLMEAMHYLGCMMNGGDEETLAA